MRGKTTHGGASGVLIVDSGYPSPMNAPASTDEQMIWASINGHISPAAQACVSVLDRAFLFGDAVYEVLRTVAGRPLFWPQHARRLRASAAAIGLVIEVSDAQLRAEMQAALDAANHHESMVRLMVTRGAGAGLGMDLDSLGPQTRVMLVAPLADRSALHATGYALATVHTARRDQDGTSGVKHGDKRFAMMAQTQARARDADEALVVDPLGRVLEGASSTFFLVRSGQLCTPPLAVGILEGITRAHILALAKRLQIPVDEAPLALDDLDKGAEAFITSSTRGVVPVHHIDQRAYDVPGPITAQLMATYDTLITGDVS